MHGAKVKIMVSVLINMINCENICSYTCHSCTKLIHSANKLLSLKQQQAMILNKCVTETIILLERQLVSSVTEYSNV
jgi:hypothetical protein